jgi:hypothetical protein
LFRCGVDPDPERVSCEDWVVFPSRSDQDFKYLIANPTGGVRTTPLDCFIHQTGNCFITDGIQGKWTWPARGFGFHQPCVRIVLGKIDRNP